MYGIIFANIELYDLTSLILFQIPRIVAFRQVLSFNEPNENVFHCWNNIPCFLYLFLTLKSFSFNVKGNGKKILPKLVLKLFDIKPRHQFQEFQHFCAAE